LIRYPSKDPASLAREPRLALFFNRPFAAALVLACGLHAALFVSARPPTHGEWSMRASTVMLVRMVTLASRATDPSLDRAPTPSDASASLETAPLTAKPEAMLRRAANPPAGDTLPATRAASLSPPASASAVQAVSSEAPISKSTPAAQAGTGLADAPD
jgi:hypothetical protein